MDRRAKTMVRGQARLSVNPFVGGSFRLVGGVVLCGVAPVVMRSCACFATALLPL